MGKGADHNKKGSAGEQIPETKMPAEPENKESTDLKTKLEEKEKESKDNYEKYLRIAAELDNFKKHSIKERSELVRYGNENLIKEILPILDNIDRALEHAEKARDIDAFIDGLKIIRGQFLQRLGKFGVKQVEAAGSEFDPNLHEAVLSVESPDHEDNRVLDEFEKGYLLNDRLLKPARVSVTKHKPEAEELDQGKS
ncbi:MAG: nucleotide exchange factor GrpE [Syntrophales bacterium]|jgi:molecular chaperone GrpE|nr:nucleotide exchange factor GrpE [Syntrophales bacterium]MDD5533402.1 nucleotide exchange factor GrpE [Syntrophales bacterium]